MISHIFIVVTVTVTASLAATPDSLVNSAVVKVQAGQNGGTGTLFWQNEEKTVGYVITCKHVLGNNSVALARWRNGYSGSGRVLGLGVQHDTGIFVVDPPEHAVAIPIARDFAPQGVTVEAFGYGGQYGIPISSIKLLKWSSEVIGYNRSTKLIMLKPNAKSGDSGGPIIYNNEIVGLVQGGELAGRFGPAVTTHGPYTYHLKALVDRVFSTDYSQICGPDCIPNITVQSPRVPVDLPVPSRPSISIKPKPVKPTVEIDVDIPEQVPANSFVQCDIKGIDVDNLADLNNVSIIFKVYPKDNSIDIRDGMSFLKRTPYLIITAKKAGEYDFVFVYRDKTRFSFIEKHFEVTE